MSSDTVSAAAQSVTGCVAAGHHGHGLCYCGCGAGTEAQVLAHRRMFVVQKPALGCTLKTHKSKIMSTTKNVQENTQYIFSYVKLNSMNYYKLGHTFLLSDCIYINLFFC